MFNRVLPIKIALLLSVFAIFVGYIVASPVTWTALGVYSLIFFIFSLPLLLRWHHFLVILTWNSNAVIYLLPGTPPLWMAMVGLSLVISLAQYALNSQEKYLFVSELIRPLVFLLILVLLTVLFKGGVGLSIFGGHGSGGKKTVFVIGAILGYFVLTRHTVKTGSAYLYASLFFLGGVSSVIGNFLPLVNPAFYFIFGIFPPEESGFEALGLINTTSDVTRFAGIAFASAAVFSALLMNYGIRGIVDFRWPLHLLPFSFKGGFQINRPWRLIIFLTILVLSLLGGFRLLVLIFALTLGLQLYLEKLYRSRLFLGILLMALLGGAIVLPMARKLPLNMQRALSFLPIDVDPVARGSAQSSTEWRLEMWKRLLPEIPRHLLIGKGYEINTHDLEILTANQSRGQVDTIEVAILAGDYHNGILSLIIPFGLPGVAGFVWLLWAGFKVLRDNYRYGPPELLRLNRFLLSFFMARAIYFFVFFGSFSSDFFLFTGVLGLSVSINRGVCKKPLKEMPADFSENLFPFKS
ncbi:MAG: O-antigen ligase family protein [Verrucomicrobiota bacterium]